MPTDNGEYGKAAQQFFRQPQGKVRDALSRHPCKQCGKASEGDFCSDACSVEHHEEAKKKREEIEADAKKNKDAVLNWAGGNTEISSGPGDTAKLTLTEKKVSGVA